MSEKNPLKKNRVTAKFYFVWLKKSQNLVSEYEYRIHTLIQAPNVVYSIL